MGLSREDIVQIAVLLVGCLLVVLNYTLLAPALPVIMREMQVTETTVQWLTSVYSLVEAVIIPLNAFFLGRFSTRKLFAGALVLFAVGSFVVAIGPTFGVLILGRVLQACAGGIIMPMVFTLVLLTTPIEHRGQVMGLVGVVISFAPAIGPPASGALIDIIGWRVLFLGVAALGLVAVIVVAKLLKDRHGFERTSFDIPSIILSSLGMLGLLYGLSTITSTPAPWASAAMMVIGIVLLAVFARRQDTLETPMLRIETLKTRNFRNAIVVVCLLEAALIAIDVLLPLYLQNSLGQTPTATGLVMAPAALAGAVSGVVAGRIFDRHGVRKIVLVGAVLLETSAIAFCFAGGDALPAAVAGIYMVETIGWQFVSTPTNTWGINSLPNEIIQHGNAVLSTLMQVGASFGTAAIVSLTAFGPAFAPAGDAALATLVGYQIAFAGCAVMLAIVTLVVLVGIRNR